MKLITLNIWSGKLQEEIKSFLNLKQNVDIFCFQEVYNRANGKDLVFLHNAKGFNSYDLLLNTLNKYNGFYHPHLIDFWGLSIFIKKEIKHLDVGDLFVYSQNGINEEVERSGLTAKNIQYIKFKQNSKLLTVINFHGLWNGKGKSDSQDRIKQTENIISFLKILNKENSEIILAGDFNLLPDTQSIKMLEDFGLINLIKTHDIKSTRTSYYTKPEKYADYIFVTEGIKVNEFKVLLDEVSDHSPLYLDFDL